MRGRVSVLGSILHGKDHADCWNSACGQVASWAAAEYVLVLYMTNRAGLVEKASQSYTTSVQLHFQRKKNKQK